SSVPSCCCWFWLPMEGPQLEAESSRLPRPLSLSANPLFIKSLLMLGRHQTYRAGSGRAVTARSFGTVLSRGCAAVRGLGLPTQTSNFTKVRVLLLPPGLLPFSPD